MILGSSYVYSYYTTITGWGVPPNLDPSFVNPCFEKLHLGEWGSQHGVKLGSYKGMYAAGRILSYQYHMISPERSVCGSDSSPVRARGGGWGL